MTFHRAYGYEESVEGIRPVLDQAAEAQVRYEIHDGAFKRIALRAAAEGLRMDGEIADFDELWELLIRDLAQEGDTRLRQAGKNYEPTLSGQGNIRARPCEVDAEGNVDDGER